MKNVFSDFDLKYLLNQGLSTVCNHPLALSLSNWKFWQKVIWGNNWSSPGTRRSIKSASPFNIILCLFISQREPITYSESLFILLTAVFYFSLFFMWSHSTLFRSFNTDFKCLFFNGECFSYTCFWWSCESNKLDYFATSFVVAINSLF